VALARGRVAAFVQGGATRKDLTAQDMELLALAHPLLEALRPPLGAGALEALAGLNTKKAKAPLTIAEEAPEVFAQALEEAKALP
jgi:hypothetical protein